MGAFAQGVSFGLKGGLNISNVDASGGGLSLDTKTYALGKGSHP